MYPQVVDFELNQEYNRRMNQFFNITPVCVDSFGYIYYYVYFIMLQLRFLECTKGQLL